MLMPRCMASPKSPKMSEAVAFDFSDEEIAVMLDNLDEYTPDEVVEIEKMVDELEAREGNQLAYDDLIEFCKAMMSDFIVGKHHRILADMLMAIEKGDKDRVCVTSHHVTVSRS